MRKIYERTQLPRPKPIKIKFDPSKDSNEIVMPKIQYEIVATVNMETKFTGNVTPIPTVLIHFLNHSELKVFSMIMDATYKTGKCTLMITDMAKILCSSAPTIGNILSSMRRRGLIFEEPYGRGSRKARMINIKAIQHLNDILEGEDPGIFSRISRATRKYNIQNLTKEDIRNAYDNKILPPDHDPAEEEEYD